MIQMDTALPNPIRLGLTGWPLEHSFSPRIHTAALEVLHLDGEYVRYPIPPSPPHHQGLRQLLQRMRSRELHGLNVTIPYKETIISLLDELTPTARAIGAVNTILMRDDKLIGENTDAPAFMADLENAGAVPAVSSGRKALILGAGGAARAVVFGLVDAGWAVMVAARRAEQGENLAAGPGKRRIRVVPFPLERHNVEDDLDLIVNATPLGMHPHPDTSPWPADVPFPSHAFVYDLVYNPEMTSLVKCARNAGLGAISGLGMLLEQAALAWEIWTGLSAPREVMRQTLQVSMETG